MVVWVLIEMRFGGVPLRDSRSHCSSDFASQSDLRVGGYAFGEPRRRLSARAFAAERPINNNFKIKPSHVLYMEKVKARCIRRALTFV